MGRNRIFIEEARRNVRVNENTRVLWHIKDAGLVGQGWVRNISTSGMRVELASDNALSDQSVLSFDSDHKDFNYIPEEGQLVWLRKKKFFSDRYICGIQFTYVPETLSTRLKARVHKGVERRVQLARIEGVCRIVLSVITVGLILYAFALENTILKNLSLSNKQLFASSLQQSEVTREYQRLYADSTLRLADATIELNQVVALFHESQQALDAARQELAVLQSVLTQTEGMLAQAEGAGAIPIISNQNPQTIVDIEQGKKLIALYHEGINQVKEKIQWIRRANHLDKIVALKERDKVKLAYGNQGFFTRNGQIVKVNPNQYNASNFAAIESSRGPLAHENVRPGSKIRVDVTVFQDK